MRALLAALLFASCAAGPAVSTEPPVIYFRGEVDDTTTAAVLAKMVGHDEVTLVISSIGGSVIYGMYFIQDVEELRRHGLVVHCVADVVAASMAANILESPACSDRSVTARSILVFHGIQSPPSELIRALDLAIANMVAPRLQMTPEEFLAKIAKGDWIMGAKEAVAAHAVDQLIP